MKLMLAERIRTAIKIKKVHNSQGRSFKDKTPVFGLIERGGKLTAMVVPNTEEKTLLPIISNFVKPTSTIYTDEWTAYKNLKKQYKHSIVDHGKKQYVNDKAYTNTLEGAWTNLKNNVKATHRHVSRKHLQNYVHGFVFRYNTRKETNTFKIAWCLWNINKRVTYKGMVNG